MEAWKIKHPQWIYKLWTEGNLPKIRNQHQFDNIQSFAGKSDILRYEILNRWGGVYVDVDMECIHPLEDTLCKFKFFATYENEHLRPGIITNSVVGSQPQHPILHRLIDEIGHLKDLNQAPDWMRTGPILFTKVMKDFRKSRKVVIFPGYSFNPVHYLGFKYIGPGKIYAIHHWLSTIERREMKLLNSTQNVEVGYIL